MHLEVRKFVRVMLHCLAEHTAGDEYPRCALRDKYRWICSNFTNCAISQIILECGEKTAERTKEMYPQQNISNLRSQSNAIYILNRPQQIIGCGKVMKTVAARAMPRQIDTEIFRPSPSARHPAPIGKSNSYTEWLCMHLSQSTSKNSNRSSRCKSNTHLQSEGKSIEPQSYYRGADTSLARPGRKQATATKLLTYASHSKKFRSLSVQPDLRDSNDLRVERKMATFELFFRSGLC